jgi:glutamate dehydrogenase (NADP+)
MCSAIVTDLSHFMHGLERRNPGEPEFHQAVQEVVETLLPFVNEHALYREAQILERLTEADRIIIFRVCWEDDEGHIRVNRGWRVQFNNALGPYKGGLRFHSDVTLGTLKFLGFEQCFKNALTGLPMGGAKGGANFNPKGKSDREVMRFCQSFMVELHHHIGEHTDVPAGDIGVGAREVGYLFGHYKRLENKFTGVLTGKGLGYGGSLIRKEATGYGCVYFAENMLGMRGDSVAGKTCTISGSGNVSIYTAEKLIELGAKVLTLSDSDGYIHDPDGMDAEKLAFIKELKEVHRGRIAEYAEHFKRSSFHKGKRPWDVPCQLAFPCATQNELDGKDAAILIKNGLIAVSEGANMPSTLDAVHSFLKHGILFGPAKAANAGGVAVSGLEQSQNSLRLSWDRDEVDNRLQKIMLDIHSKCVRYGANPSGKGANAGVNYVKGANIAGFVRLADAMIAQGIV